VQAVWGVGPLGEDDPEPQQQPEQERQEEGEAEQETMQDEEEEEAPPAEDPCMYDDDGVPDPVLLGEDQGDVLFPETGEEMPADILEGNRVMQGAANPMMATYLETLAINVGLPRREIPPRNPDDLPNACPWLRPRPEEGPEGQPPGAPPEPEGDAPAAEEGGVPDGDFTHDLVHPDMEQGSVHSADRSGGEGDSSSSSSSSDSEPDAVDGGDNGPAQVDPTPDSPPNAAEGNSNDGSDSDEIDGEEETAEAEHEDDQDDVFDELGLRGISEGWVVAPRGRVHICMGDVVRGGDPGVPCSNIGSRKEIKCHQPIFSATYHATLLVSRRHKACGNCKKD
jgi:hypothetical protein